MTRLHIDHAAGQSLAGTEQDFARLLSMTRCKCSVIDQGDTFSWGSFCRKCSGWFQLRILSEDDLRAYRAHAEEVEAAKDAEDA